MRKVASTIRKHRKGMIALSLALIMIFGSVAGVAIYHAFGPASAETVAPREIGSLEDFERYFVDPAGSDFDMGGSYVLTADLDFSGLSASAGSEAYPFTGTFDGDGHVLTGLARPLFGVLRPNALVENLTLDGAVITEPALYGSEETGYVEGYAPLAAYAAGATIRNCAAVGEIYPGQPQERPFEVIPEVPEKPAEPVETPVPSDMPSPAESAGPMPEPSESVTPSEAPSESAVPTPSESVRPSESVQPTSEPSATAKPTATAKPSQAPAESAAPTPGETSRPTPEPAPSAAPSAPPAESEKPGSSAPAEDEKPEKPAPAESAKPESSAPAEGGAPESSAPESSAPDQNTESDAAIPDAGVPLAALPRGLRAAPLNMAGVSYNTTAALSAVSGEGEGAALPDPAPEQPDAGEAGQETDGPAPDTDAPAESGAPDAPSAPAESEEPDGSPAPAETGAPEETGDPEDTASPAPTQGVDAGDGADTPPSNSNQITETVPLEREYIYVTAGQIEAGGLVAYVAEGTEITDCYTFVTLGGDFTAQADETGGTEGPVPMMAGGFAARVAEGASIVNCYSTGLVDCSDASAGFVCANAGSITGCFTTAVMGQTKGEKAAFVLFNAEADEERDYPGGVLEGCAFDRQMACVEDQYVTGMDTANMTGLEADLPGGVWHLAADAYPQLPYFAANENETVAQRSKASAIALVLPEGKTLVETLAKGNNVLELPEQIDGEPVEWAAEGGFTLAGDGRAVLGEMPEESVGKEENVLSEEAAPEAEGAAPVESPGPSDAAAMPPISSEEPAAQPDDGLAVMSVRMEELPDQPVPLAAEPEENAPDDDTVHVSGSLTGTLGGVSKTFTLTAAAANGDTTLDTWNIHIAIGGDYPMNGTLYVEGLEPACPGYYRSYRFWYDGSVTGTPRFTIRTSNGIGIINQLGIERLKIYSTGVSTDTWKRSDVGVGATLEVNNGNVTRALISTGPFCLTATWKDVGRYVEQGAIGTKPTMSSDGYYQIYTPEQLAWACYYFDYATSAASSGIRLMNNIDLAGTAYGYSASDPLLWTGFNNYAGTFDGNWKTITNMKGSSNTNGLFNSTTSTAVIQNLTIGTGSSINPSTATWAVGGIVGTNGGTVQRCVNYANVSASFADQDMTMGGISGNGGTVRDCINYGAVNSSKQSGSWTGGINGGGKAENCYNAGKVTGSSTSSTRIGGVHGSYGSSTNSYYDNTLGHTLSAGKQMGTPLNGDQRYTSSVAALLNGSRSGADAPWRFKPDGYPYLVAPGASYTDNWANYTMYYGDTYKPSTLNSVYQIGNANQLAWFMDYVNKGNDTASAKLTANISLSGRTWAPIGNPLKPYRGTFDGGGYAISNLNMTFTSAYIGFFGRCESAAISNLGLTSGTVKGGANTGALTGGLFRASGSTVAPSVKQCYNSGVTVNGTGAQVAGLVGYCANAVVEDCYNTAAVTGSGAYVGGIIGSDSSGYESGSIKNNYNTGKITGGSSVGAIVGWHDVRYDMGNNYYLTGTASTGIGLNANGTANTNHTPIVQTADQMRLPTFTYYLNAERATADTPWRYQVYGSGTNMGTYAGNNGYPDFTDRVTDWQARGAYVSRPNFTWDGSWEIETADHLAWFMMSVNSGEPLGALNLRGNISLAGRDWVPMGSSSSYPLKCNLAGGGYTITNMTVNQPGKPYAGLIGYVENSTIENLTLGAGCSVAGQAYVGGIVGYASSTTIQNCTNAASILGSTSAADQGFGGIVGHTAGTTSVTNCTNTAAVTSGKSNYGYVGGIVGNGSGSGGITNCRNTGAIGASGKAPYYSGGIVGILSSGTLSKCGNTAAVYATYRVGGVAGASSSGTTVTDCYNRGSVTCTGSSTIYAGGLVGLGSSGAKITNSYNAGAVTCTGGLGGVVGSSGATVTNCYYDMTLNTTSAYYAYGGTAVATGVLKSQAMPVMLNNGRSTSVWAADTSNSNGGFAIFGTTAKPANWQAVGALWTEAELAKLIVSNTDTTPALKLNGTTWEVARAEGLAWLMNQVNSGTLVYKNIKLVADLDLSGLVYNGNLSTTVNNSLPWVPMGLSSASYTGTFYGNGKTVRYMNITAAPSGSTNVGLLGYVSGGRVENLTVADSGLNMTNTTGYAGGIVGYATGSAVISNCVSKVAMAPTGSISWAGGVVGYLNSASVLDSSFLDFNITSTQVMNFGGIVGYSSNGTVQRSFARGTKMTATQRLGGIASYLANTAVVGNSYVVANELAGGGGYTGGLVGAMGSTSVRVANSYAAVNVFTGNPKDALASGDGTVTRCLYLSNSGGTTSTKGTAVTAKQLQGWAVAYYLNGDSRNGVWALDSAASPVNKGYPVLLASAGTLRLPTWGEVGEWVAISWATKPSLTAIDSAEGLAYLAYLINNGSGADATLTGDIDLTGTAYGGTEAAPITWTPIGKAPAGDEDGSYRSAFNGQGHTIRHMAVAEQNYAGLFGYISGGTVSGVNVDSSCTVKPNEMVAYSGGIAGAINGGTVKDCTSAASISSVDTMYVGGVAGAVSPSSGGGTMENCGYLGGSLAITAGVSSNVGGVAGLCGPSGKLVKCYSTAASIQGGTAGGVVGQCWQDSAMTNCYSTARTISAKLGSAAGIAGSVYPTTTIQNCYSAAATVTIPIADGGAVTNCYFDSACGLTATAGSTAKTTAELKSIQMPYLLNGSKYGEPWDFDYLGANGGYPLFGSLEQATWSTVGKAQIESKLRTDGWLTGTGTSADPYVVKSPEALAWFSYQVESDNDNFKGKSVKLGGNINLMGATYGGSASAPLVWTPIGRNNNYVSPSIQRPYSGTVDGNGKTVSYMFCQGDGYSGLVGYLTNGTVKNLTIDSTCRILGPSNGGYGAVGGGVVGAAFEASVIQDCFSSVQMEAGTGKLLYNLGGIVGTMGGTTQVLRCGSIDVSLDPTTVSGLPIYGGGIAGNVGGGTKVLNCYSVGLSTTRGSTSSGYGEYTGGIAGIAGASAEIKNCYAAKAVLDAKTAAAPIVGSGASAIIDNCIYDKQTITRQGTGAALTGLGLGVNTTQLQSWGAAYQLNGAQSVFANNNVWNYVSGKYPILNTALTTMVEPTTWQDVGEWVDNFNTAAKPTLSGTNYTIANANQMAWFAYKVNSDNANFAPKGVVLSADIPLDGTTYGYSTTAPLPWTPLGNSTQPNGSSYTGRTYQGVFNGNGRTVNYLRVNTVDRFNGFIGDMVGGSITNLTVSGTGVAGIGYTGGIVGRATNTIINYCNNKVPVIGHSTALDEGFGGIVGYTSGTTSVKNSGNTASIYSSRNNYGYVGGIVGYQGSTGGISGCINSGSVGAFMSSGSSYSSMYCGGIAGLWYYGTIDKCGNTGTITFTARGGGIVGQSRTTHTLQNSYNLGTVKGGGSCGGLVGDFFSDDAYTLTILNSYNSGAVTGTNAGGIVGTKNVSGSGVGTLVITNTYYDSSKNAAASYATLGGVGKTTAQLQTWGAAYQLNGAKEPFSGNNVWTYTAGLYPALGTLGAATGWQQVGQWVDNFAPTLAATGAGTSASPYVITTPEALAWYMYKVNTGTTSSAYIKGYVRLDDNIDLAGTKYTGYTNATYLLWNGIGMYGSLPFTGNFNGNGHFVDHMNANQGVNGSGFIRYATNATITGLGIGPNSRVVGAISAGGIVGISGSGAGVNLVITDCYNRAEIQATNQSAAGILGGGNLGVATISNCYNTGAITSPGSKGAIYSSTTTYVTVNNCYYDNQTTGTVTVNRGEVGLATSYMKMWGAAAKLNAGRAGANSVWNYTTAKNDGYPSYGQLEAASDWSQVGDSFTEAELKAAAVTGVTGVTYALSGSGTTASPYVIASPEALAWFMRQVNLGSPTLCGTLAADIDLTGAAYGGTAATPIAWIPIGATSARTYTGTFNSTGGTRMVDHVRVNYSDVAGFFAYTSSATISGLGIGPNSSIVSQSSHAGGIVGSGLGTTQVERCYNKGSVRGAPTSDGGVGGIIGTRANTSLVKNCYNQGPVSGTFRVGGISGWVGGIENCYNSGKLTGTSGITLVGGITGTNSPTGVKDCLWDRTTSGATSGSGGGTLDASVVGVTTAQLKTWGAAYQLNNSFSAFPTGDSSVWTWTSGEYPSFGTLPAAQSWDDVGAWVANFATAQKPSGGGTSDSPYLLATPEQVAWFAYGVNSGDTNMKTAYARLEADIDLFGGKYTGQSVKSAANALLWMPIGQEVSGKYYAGTFGQGGSIHEVDYMRVENPAGVANFAAGFFGYTYDSNIYYVGIGANSTVKNTTGSPTAGVVAQPSLAQAGESNRRTIAFCYNKATITGSNYAGGIAAAGNAFIDIKNCYNLGAVKGGTVAGGITGWWRNQIINCYNAGKVTGSIAGAISGTKGGDSYPSNLLNNCIFDPVASGVSIAAPAYTVGKITNTFSVTPAQLKSWGAAYQLNQDTSAVNNFPGSNVWTYDAAVNGGYPTFGGLSQPDSWDDVGLWVDAYAPAKKPTGTGADETNAYQIGTPEALAWFAYQSDQPATLEQFNKACVKLTADLDMFGTKYTGKSGALENALRFDPMFRYGGKPSVYQGTFDGGGHVLDSIRIYLNSDSGLFQSAGYGAVIKNLGIGPNSSVTGTRFVGAFVSIPGGLNTELTITDCYNRAPVSSIAYGTAGTRVSGIVGGGNSLAGASAIQNCYNTGKLINVNEPANLYAIASYANVISNCYYDSQTTGTVAATAGVTGLSTADMKIWGTAYKLNGEKIGAGTVWNWDKDVSKNNGYPCFGELTGAADWSHVGAMQTEAGLKATAVTGITGVSRALSGSGTSASPYIIATPEALAWYMNQVNTNKAAFGATHAQLAADMDLYGDKYTGATGTKTVDKALAWVPIGKLQYAGNFGSTDGSVRVVDYMHIVSSGNDFGGFFSELRGATVRCVGIGASSKSEGPWVTGGVAGYVGSSTDGNSTPSLIEKCYNLAQVSGTGNWTGGVVGWMGNGSTIKNCYNRGDVSSTSNYVGGVVGYMNHAGTTVSNSFNAANVTSTGTGAYKGGIVGYINAGLVQSCIMDMTLAPSVTVYGAGLAGSFTITDSNRVATAEMKTWGAAYRLNGAPDLSASPSIGWDYVPAENDGYPSFGTSMTPAADWQEVGRFVNNFSTKPDGSGTTGSPYVVSTPEALAWFMYNFNAEETKAAADRTFQKAHVTLTADIDLFGKKYTGQIGASDVTQALPWTPMGHYSGNGFELYVFTGVFAGDTVREIDHLYINDVGKKPGTGLFGALGTSTVRSVGIGANSSITSVNWCVGGISGWSSGTAIERCYNKASVTYDVTNGNNSNSSYAAGLVGAASGGSITNCYNLGPITGGNCLFGIASGSNSSSSPVTNSYNAGKMTSSVASPIEVFPISRGDVQNNCWYDSQTTGAAGGAGTGVTTTQLQSWGAAYQLNQAKAALADNNVWTYTAGAYPTYGAQPAAANWQDVGVWVDDFANVGVVATVTAERKIPALTSGAYQITSPEQLAWAAYKVNTDNDNSKAINLTLTGDVDLFGARYSGVAKTGTVADDIYQSLLWEPIGLDYEITFGGTLEGGGHSVGYMRSDRTTSYMGLIGHLKGGEAKNLTIQNTCLHNGGRDDRGTSGGGVAGYITEGAAIRDCVSALVVSMKGMTDNGASLSSAGAIVGQMGANSLVERCAAVGANIDGTGVGGLNCYYGGVAGNVYGTVTDSYSRDTVVKGPSGLSTSYSGYTGGVVGYLFTNSALSNCYVTDAKLSGNNAQRALYGNSSLSTGVTFENCYYNGTTVTNASTDQALVNSPGILLTTDQMKTPALVQKLNATATPANGRYGDSAVWYVDDETTATNAGYPTFARAISDWQDVGAISKAPAVTSGVYQLGTPEELAWFMASLNSGKADTGATNKLAMVMTTNAALTADINLTGTAYGGTAALPLRWIPIGSDFNFAYQGTFDGTGKSLDYMSVRGSWVSGLFGATSAATVKNLTLAPTCTIAATGSAVSGVTGAAGGLIGTASGTTMRDCVSSVQVTGKANQYVGGLVGYAVSSSKLERCAAIDVSTITSSPIGDFWYSGGLVGWASGSEISDSYSVGYTVSGTTDRARHYHGGLVGTLTDGVLTNCYSAVMSSTDPYTSSALVGNYSGTTTATNCYYDSETMKKTSNGTTTALTDTQATPKTTAEMQSEALVKLLAGTTTGGNNRYANNVLESQIWFRTTKLERSKGYPDFTAPTRITSMDDWYRYLITNGADKNLDGRYILMPTADTVGGTISMNGLGTTAGLETNKPFTGILYGNSVVLTNLRRPLLGLVDGTASERAELYDLTIESGFAPSTSLAYTNSVGSMVDYVRNGRLTNCTAYITNLQAANTLQSVGGLVGQAMNAGMDNCFVMGRQAVVGGSNVQYVGGLVGRTDSGNSSTFTNCAAMSDGSVHGTLASDVYGLTISGTSNLGGLVGSGNGTNTFDGCHTSVTVTGRGTRYGGIVGLGDKMTITNCSTAGTILNPSGSGNVGAFVAAGNNITQSNNLCYTSVILDNADSLLGISTGNNNHYDGHMYPFQGSADAVTGLVKTEYDTMTLTGTTNYMGSAWTADNGRYPYITALAAAMPADVLKQYQADRNRLHQSNEASTSDRLVEKLSWSDTLTAEELPREAGKPLMTIDADARTANAATRVPYITFLLKDANGQSKLYRMRADAITIWGQVELSIQDSLTPAWTAVTVKDRNGKTPITVPINEGIQRIEVALVTSENYDEELEGTLGPVETTTEGFTIQPAATLVGAQGEGGDKGVYKSSGSDYANANIGFMVTGNSSSDGTSGDNKFLDVGSITAADNVHSLTHVTLFNAAAYNDTEEHIYKIYIYDAKGAKTIITAQVKGVTSKTLDITMPIGTPRVTLNLPDHPSYSLDAYHIENNMAYPMEVLLTGVEIDSEFNSEAGYQTVRIPVLNAGYTDSNGAAQAGFDFGDYLGEVDKQGVIFGVTPYANAGDTTGNGQMDEWWWDSRRTAADMSPFTVIGSGGTLDYHVILDHSQLYFGPPAQFGCNITFGCQQAKADCDTGSAIPYSSTVTTTP